jgi:glycosyltransferase involved in cell wall biosynthesis
VRVLQVSAAHVYLTYPFVLSWSLLEAMACGCAIVASNTAPVREVLTDRVNARLLDFFAMDDLAKAVFETLSLRSSSARSGASECVHTFRRDSALRTFENLLTSRARLTTHVVDAATRSSPECTTDAADGKYSRRRLSNQQVSSPMT